MKLKDDKLFTDFFAHIYLDCFENDKQCIIIISVTILSFLCFHFLTHANSILVVSH